MLAHKTIEENHAARAAQTVSPRVNIYETDKEVVLEAEMAGASKETVGVEIEGDELRIRGRSASEPPKEFAVVYAERVPSDYSRTFLLSSDIRRDKVDARYENGSLTVTLYKAEKPQPRKIVIQ